ALQDLPVKHVADRRRRTLDELLGAQVKQHHGRRALLGNGAQLTLDCGLLDACCQQIQKRLPFDDTSWIERKAQILGKRTLAGAIEARHPDADFGDLASLYAILVNIQELAEISLDVRRGFVLTDFDG